MKKTFGILIVVFTIIWSILIGSPLSIFIEPRAVLIVFGTIFGTLVARHSWKEFLNYSEDVSTSVYNSSILGGLIGFSIGILEMLQKLSDPSLIGLGMAVAFLSLFNALLICISSLFISSKKNQPSNVEKKFIPWKFCLGTLIVIVVILLSASYGMSIHVYIDNPSFLGLFGIIVGALITRHSVQDLREYNSEVCKTLMYSSYFGGGLITIIGFVQILQNMPDLSSLGPAMVVGILPVLYGLIVALIAYLASTINILYSKGLAVGFGSVVLVMGTFFILLVSFAKNF